MKKTKEEAEKTRQALINAAIQVFSEKGYRSATLVEIAKKAGVTRGAVYWHFDSKAEIFDALHDRIHQPFVDVVSEGLTADRSDPIGLLHDLWVKLFNDLEEDEPRRQALTLFIKKPDYSGELAIYKDEHFKKQEESILLFQHFFEKMRQSGSLPNNIDHVLFIEGMFCFMKGVLLEYLDDPLRFDLENKIPKLIHWFFTSSGFSMSLTDNKTP